MDKDIASISHEISFLDTELSSLIADQSRLSMLSSKEAIEIYSRIKTLQDKKERKLAVIEVMRIKRGSIGKELNRFDIEKQIESYINRQKELYQLGVKWNSLIEEANQIAAEIERLENIDTPEYISRVGGDINESIRIRFFSIQAKTDSTDKNLVG